MASRPKSVSGYTRMRLKVRPRRSLAAHVLHRRECHRRRRRYRGGGGGGGGATFRGRGCDGGRAGRSGSGVRLRVSRLFQGSGSSPTSPTSPPQPRHRRPVHSSTARRRWPRRRGAAPWAPRRPQVEDGPSSRTASGEDGCEPAPRHVCSACASGPRRSSTGRSPRRRVSSEEAVEVLSPPCSSASLRRRTAAMPHIQASTTGF